MGVNTKSVSLISSKMADVDISLCMPEYAFALSFVIFPLSNINSAISPLLDSEPLSLVYFVLLVE
jgi:hypothetical protein